MLGHAANANDVTTFRETWHSYDAEAMAAVQAWAVQIARLIDPKQNSADAEECPVKVVEELAITEGIVDESRRPRHSSSSLLPIRSVFGTEVSNAPVSTG